MATNAQIVTSLADAQALVDNGSVTAARMLALATVALGDLLRGHVANYQVGGRSTTFMGPAAIQSIIDYYQRRVDAGSNSIAVNLAEL